MYHPPVPRLVLASASPRRLELLSAAGFEVAVDPANVDETRMGDETPASYVLRLARLKAESVAARHPGQVVLGADTVVVVGGALLGKPRDADDASAMLRRLSGRAHHVMTGVAVVAHGQTHAEVETTTVWVSEVSPADVAWYAASGEPLDKAGGYAIQGLASRFIPRIEGSYSNVVGLPVATVFRLMRRAAVFG